MKRKRYYIAYGSNLSEEQMKVRCPDARPAGMAVLWDMKLVFRFHATIEPCIGETVPVLVWEISEADERNLDRYEAFPSYYRKEEKEIQMTSFRGKDPRKITAMVYIMNDGRPASTPMKEYYDVLDRAYTRFGFNRALLEKAMEEAKEAELHDLS